MTTAFRWQDDYSVKVRAMDEQHKKLFELLNELQNATASGNGHATTGEVLRRLVDYTVHHFSAEERLMEKYRFAGLPTHRGEHTVLRERVLAFQQEFDAGSAEATPELTKFLQRWLTHHILTVDQRYSDFLNAKGIR